MNGCATIQQRLAAVAAANFDHGWLHFDDHWHLWHEVAGAAEQLAAALAGGDTITVITRNDPTCATALASALLSGISTVSIDALVSDSELGRELARAAERTKLIVATDDDWTRAKDLAPDLERVVVDGVHTTMPPRQGTSRFGVRGDDPVAVELSTSGTTGPPKRFQMRYSQLSAALDQTRAHIYTRAGFGAASARRSAAIVHAPLSHVGGFFRLVDNAAEPRPILLMSKFEPERWSELVERFDVKVDGLNPTAVRMVLDADVPAERLRSLRAVRCGMAPLAVDVQHDFEARYSVAVLRAYGATEFSGEVAGWTLAEYRELGSAKRGSVGRLHAGVDARVVADDGQPLKHGSAGRLQLRSEHIGSGEWVATNDVAIIDDDRFVWIVGRADEVINRGGFKLAPDTVRDVIAGHADVRDVAVVGLPDIRLGEVIGAAIVARPDSQLSAEQIRSWCATRLARYMVPDDVVFLERLPMLRSLKVDRQALREMFRT